MACTKLNGTKINRTVDNVDGFSELYFSKSVDIDTGVTSYWLRSGLDLNRFLVTGETGYSFKETALDIDNFYKMSPQSSTLELPTGTNIYKATIKTLSSAECSNNAFYNKKIYTQGMFLDGGLISPNALYKKLGECAWLQEEASIKARYEVDIIDTHYGKKEKGYNGYYAQEIVIIDRKTNEKLASD